MPPSAPLLHVVGLSRVLGSGTVLENLTFEIREGEVLGVLGPNGAGKTTLLECLLGLQDPDSGAVRAAHSRNIRARLAALSSRRGHCRER